MRQKVTEVTHVMEWGHASGASFLQPVSRALEAFGFLMLKYVFSHIAEALLL